MGGILFTGWNASQYFDRRVHSFCVGRTGLSALPATKDGINEGIAEHLNHGLPKDHSLLDPMTLVLSITDASLKTAEGLERVIQHRILCLLGFSETDAQLSVEPICNMTQEQLLSHADYSTTTQTVLDKVTAIRYRIFELKGFKIQLSEGFALDAAINGLSLNELLKNPQYQTITHAVWHTILAIQCKMLQSAKLQVQVPSDFKPHPIISSMNVGDLWLDQRYQTIMQAVWRTLKDKGIHIPKPAWFQNPHSPEVALRALPPAAPHAQPNLLTFTPKGRKAYGSTDSHSDTTSSQPLVLNVEAGEGPSHSR
jgi:hypothetical protein